MTPTTTKDGMTGNLGKGIIAATTTTYGLADLKREAQRLLVGSFLSCGGKVICNHSAAYYRRIGEIAVSIGSGGNVSLVIGRRCTRCDKQDWVNLAL